MPVTNLPVKLTICGKVYRVIRQEDLIVNGDPAYGLVDLDYKAIQLARKCDGKPVGRNDLFATIVHEIAHIVMNSLPCKRMSEETKATFIGREVARAICRNRAMLSYLLKG